MSTTLPYDTLHPGPGESVHFNAVQLRERYDHLARRYDRIESPLELLGLRRLRRQLLSRARGEVLEVAVGTGRNLRYYPRGASLTGVDLSPGMLEVAWRRATRMERCINLRVMDAEHLEFEDGRFDVVTSSLGVCTFPDPIAALREMARVCRPEGRIMLLEHGRSSVRWLAWFQDREAAAFARRTGCHWNREPLELVRMAGLRVVRDHRALYGIVHVIVAMPGPRTASV